MARPSKVEVERREKIKELGLFVRDSDIYIIFEKHTSEINPNFIPYSFCKECYHRVFAQSEEALKFFPNGVKNNFLGLGEITNDINKLHSINHKLFTYYMLTGLDNICDRDREPHKPYFVSNLIYHDDIQNILGKERADEISPSRYFEYMQDELTEHDIQKFKNYFENNPISGEFHKTIIEQNHTRYASCDLTDMNKKKSAYVELDFTKPLEELLAFVTLIKKDFDAELEKGNNIIPTLYDLLGIGGEIYKCDLTDCAVYKTNNVKPLGGRLADVLFIYDCKKANEILGANIFTNEYIQKEINRYWQQVKKLFPINTDNIQDETVSEYYNLAKDYIDNKKYKCYISGYDIAKETNLN